MGRSVTALALALVCAGLMPGHLTLRADDDARGVDTRVQAALDLWRSGDRHNRLEALRRLGRWGHRSAPAVPEILAGLTDADPLLRKQTADALGDLGSVAAPAHDQLIALLNDADGEVRYAAALALVSTGLDLKRTADPLLAWAVRDSRAGRANSLSVLTCLGKDGLPLLARLLDSQDSRLVGTAALHIGDQEDAAAHLAPKMIATFARLTVEDQNRVAQALSRIGRPAVEPLLVALEQNDSKLRPGIYNALDKIGSSAEAAVPAMVVRLPYPGAPDEPANLREPLFPTWVPDHLPQGPHRVLASIGWPAVPALLKELARPEPAARLRGVRALGALGANGRGAVPRLIGLLAHPDTRVEAAAALGRVGSYSARDALPRLGLALKTRDPVLRTAAALALGRIGADLNRFDEAKEDLIRLAVNPLVAALSDVDQRVCVAALGALREMGETSTSAIPRILPLLRDPVAEVRIAAQQALGTPGPGAMQKLEEPVVGLKDPDVRVRRAAAQSLTNPWLMSEKVARAVLEAQADPDEQVRFAIARTLARTSGKGWFCLRGREVEKSEEPVIVWSRVPGAEAMLQQALASADSSVRAGAAYALGAAHLDPARSVALLTERLADSSPPVRFAAAVALKRFGAAARPALPALFQAMADRTTTESLSLNLFSAAALAIVAIDPSATEKVFGNMEALLIDPRYEISQAAFFAVQDFPRAGTLYLRRLAAPTTSRALQVRLMEAFLSLPFASRPFGDPRPAQERPDAAAVAAVLPVLHALAQDDESKLRDSAESMLERLVPPTTPTVSSLIESVARGDKSLGEVKPDLGNLTLAEIHSAIQTIQHIDPDVRTLAAVVLFSQSGRLASGFDAKSATGKPALQHETEQERSAARKQALAALLRAIRDPDTQVQFAAIWCAVQVSDGPDERVQVLNALLPLLNDRTTRLREDGWLYKNDWRQPGLGPAIYRDEDLRRLRLHVISVLPLLEGDAARAISALRAALREKDPAVCSEALVSLPALGGVAREAMPELITILKCQRDRLARSEAKGSGARPKEENDRAGNLLGMEAIMATGGLEPGAAAVVPVLIELLDVNDRDVRRAVISALGSIGPDAQAAIPRLSQALHDPLDMELAAEAATALAGIGPLAVPVLVAALRDPASDLRCMAAQALGNSVGLARMVQHDLERALNDEDCFTRAQVKAALKAIADQPAEPANAEESRQ